MRIEKYVKTQQDFSVGCPELKLTAAFGEKMRNFIQTEQIKAAALAVTHLKLPPKLVIEPLLVKEFGLAYLKRSGARLFETRMRYRQAGYIITRMMRDLGYKVSDTLKMPDYSPTKEACIFSKNLG